MLRFAQGLYSDYYPSATDDDLFVEIRFETPLPENLVQNIVQAYLFELSTSLGVCLVVWPLPESFDPDDGIDVDKFPTYRLRPLLLGRGLPNLLKLYNQGVAATAADIQILLFTKGEEYGS